MSDTSRNFSNCMCCVPGCTNRYKNTDTSIKFYRFPGRWYEKEKRQMWISNIQKLSPNGKSWKLRKNDLICSTHFVGNEKSFDETSPSYIPSLFPNAALTKCASSESERHKCRLNERDELGIKRKHINSGDDNSDQNSGTFLITDEDESKSFHVNTKETSSNLEDIKDDQCNEKSTETKNVAVDSLETTEELPLIFIQMLENINKYFKKKQDDDDDDAFTNYLAAELKNIENQDFKDKVKIQILKVLVEGKRVDRERRSKIS